MIYKYRLVPYVCAIVGLLNGSIIDAKAQTLLARYAFDEGAGNITADAGSSGNDLTRQSSMTWVAEGVDGAGFSAHNASLASTSSAVFRNPATGSSFSNLTTYTITGWYRAVDGPQGGRLISMSNGSANLVELYFSGPNKDRLRLQTDVNNFAQSASAPVLGSTNEWVFFAVSVNTAASSISNGVKFFAGSRTAGVAQLSLSGNGGSIVEFNSGVINVLALGNSHNAVAGNVGNVNRSLVNTYLDEIRIYAGVLSSGDVEAIRLQSAPLVHYTFEQGTGDIAEDVGTSAIDLTRQSSMSWAAEGVDTAGYAAYNSSLNSTSAAVFRDAVSGAALNNLTAYTITGWYRAMNGPQGGRLVSMSNGSTNLVELYFSGTNHDRLRLQTDGNNFAQSASTPAIGSVNEWVFFAVSVNTAASSISNGVTFFAGSESVGVAPIALSGNGGSIGGFNSDVINVLALGNSHNCVSGNAGNVNRSLIKTYMDGIRIYAGVLSSTDIEAIRLQAVSAAGPDEAPTVESYVESGSGQVSFTLRLPGSWNYETISIAASLVEPEGGQGAIVDEFAVGTNDLANCSINFVGASEGIYALTASPTPSGQETLLGTVHVRHGGQSIPFIPVPSVNHAYPPEIAGWNAGNKAAQVVAANNLIVSIHNQLADGIKTINIPSGNYRFNAQATDGLSAMYSIKLNGLEDVTINGQGSTFWLTDPKRGIFNLTFCDNLTIRNLTVDYDPLPYVQGRVISVGNGSNPEIEFRVDPGFEEAMTVFQAIPKVPYARVHIFKDELSHGLPYSPAWIAGHDGGIQFTYDVAKGIARFFLICDSATPYIIEAGDLIAVTPRYNKQHTSITGGDVRLENVTVYSSARMGLYAEHLVEPIELERFRLMRRPNTRRLVSSCIDGLHFKYNRYGPKIINCEVEASMDDAIAIPCMNSELAEQISSTVILASTRSAAVPINMKVGSQVWFYRSSDDQLLGEAIVDAVTATGDPEEYQVTLDRSVQLSGSVIIVSDRWRGDNYLIEDCYIGNNWANAIRATGVGGVVRDTEFNRSGSLTFSMHNYWLIGCPTESLLFGGNIIREFRQSKIALSILSTLSTAGAFYDDIQIINNVFYDTSFAAVRLSDVSNLVLSGNHFERTNQTNPLNADEDAVVILQNCLGAEISDNTFSLIGPYSNWNIKIIP